MYVGIGTKDRAWQYQNRQTDHREWLDEIFALGYLMNDIVGITSKKLTKLAALEIETSLINSLRPPLNRNFRLTGNCVLDKDRYDLARELRNDGLSYLKIAKELEVSTMVIYKALNGETKKYEQFGEPV